MLNMNFFNEHLQSKKTEQKKLYRNIALFAVLALVIGGIYGVLLWSNTRSTERIAAIQEILSTAENVAYREEIDTTRRTLQVLNAYRTGLTQSNVAFDSGIKLNRTLLDVVMTALPEGAQLTALNFSGFSLRLTGTIAGAYLAPSLLADLRATNLFVDLAPITLSIEQGVTVFNVTGILKGGALQ